MKYLLILAIIIVGGYFYPQIAESKGGPCQAFEAKIADEIGGQDPNAGLLASLVSGLSNGDLGRQIATREYQSIPASFACIRAYYTLDPKDIRM